MAGLEEKEVTQLGRQGALSMVEGDWAGSQREDKVLALTPPPTC